MLLYTDGIVEARRLDRELFDIPRVVEIATQAHAEPATEICRRILASAQAWAAQQDDDQTVVVVRRGARR